MWKTKIAAIALLWGTGIAHAYMPQAGTWVVTSELDGKPGRGLAIDVQNDTLLMQMYAYEANGEPTFYLAVGKMVDSSATAELTRYTGGATSEAPRCPEHLKAARAMCPSGLLREQRGSSPSPMNRKKPLPDSTSDTPASLRA